jgi:hypothetical protein
MAQIINGVWQEPATTRADERHVTMAGEFDRLVSLLTEIVVRSQDFSEQDHKRMTSFMSACCELMSSRDRLKPDDRQIFERELRNAVARRGHYDAS